MYLMAKHAQTPATMTETERETEELRGPSLMDLHLQKKGEVEKQQQQQNMLDSKNGHSVRRAFDREKVCHVCVMCVSCVCHVYVMCVSCVCVCHVCVMSCVCHVMCVSCHVMRCDGN